MKAIGTVNYKGILKDIVNDLERLEELEKENKELKENSKEICECDVDRLNKIEKDLEVLEIIKNKRVSVNTLIVSIICAINPLEFYNEEVSSKLKLTQQEFDLLKEWLENDKQD